MITRNLTPKDGNAAWFDDGDDDDDDSDKKFDNMKFHGVTKNYERVRDQYHYTGKYSSTVFAI